MSAPGRGRGADRTTDGGMGGADTARLSERGRGAGRGADAGCCRTGLRDAVRRLLSGGACGGAGFGAAASSPPGGVVQESAGSCGARGSVEGLNAHRRACDGRLRSVRAGERGQAVKSASPASGT